MALVLKFEVKEVVDADKVQEKDNTQDHIDGDDAGWGQSGNPNRADRALMFYAEYIDENSNSEYLTQESHLVGSNTMFSVEAGDGLANTTKSTFLMESSKDGHHLFYMIPLEQDTTKVGGVAGDLYYNLDDSLSYYFNGSNWTPITDALLDTIKVLSVNQTSNKFLRKRANKKLAVATRDIYDPITGFNQGLMIERNDYRAKLDNAYSAFLDEDYATARILLDVLSRATL